MATTTFTGPVVSLNGFVGTFTATQISTDEIDAADGTAAMTIADSTGRVTFATAPAAAGLRAADGTAALAVANSTGLVTAGGGLASGTLKAADGAAALTLANSTGVVTFAAVPATGGAKAADGTAGVTIADSTGIVTVANGLSITDAKDIVLATGTGTMLGTAAAQKLGFWGAAPVIQQATTGTVTGFTAGSGTAVLDDSTFTGNSGTKAYTIGDIVLALKNAGIMAAS